MARYMYQIIEINKDDKWHTFSLYVPTTKKKEDFEDDDFDKLIETDKGNLIKKSLFSIHNMNVRDNCFDTYANDEYSFYTHGTPNDCDTETTEIIKNFMGEGYGYNTYTFTLSGLINTIANIKRSYTADKTKEDTMQFMVDFAKRLGYAKPDGNFEDDNSYYNREMLEDKELVLAGLSQLYDGINTLVEQAAGTYVSEKNIRAIMWIA